MKSLQYQGKTTISKISIYNFKCRNSIISSNTVPLIYDSESILQQFMSYHQEITHLGQRFDKCIRAANKQLKAFAQKVHLCSHLPFYTNNSTINKLIYPWFATIFPRYTSTNIISKHYHEQ